MIAVALVMLAATRAAPHAPQNQAVIAAVKGSLNDPDSAKIRDIRKTGPGSYCGWVNAKNAYGGYAGDQLFYVDNGFVQIFDLATAFDPSDLARQTDALVRGDPSAADAKPKLSKAGEKVAPCLKDYHG